MEADRSFRKRVREHDSEDELEFDWAEVKRLRDDLLNDGAFDDGAISPESAATRDLDSFMRSLQEEIISGASSSQEVNFIDLTSESGESDSGESPTELGFLLGASDDELGIPPSNNNTNNNNNSSSKVVINLESDWDRVEYDSSELSELWGYEDHVPACYDSFQFGGGERYEAEGGAYESFDVNAFDHADLWSYISTNESFFDTVQTEQ